MLNLKRKQSKLYDVTLWLSGVQYTIYCSKHDNSFDHEFGTEYVEPSHELERVVVGDYDMTEVLNNKTIETLIELFNDEIGGQCE